MFFPMKRQNRGTIFAMNCLWHKLASPWIDCRHELHLGALWIDQKLALKNAKNLKKLCFSKGNWKSNGKIPVAFSVMFCKTGTEQILQNAKWGRSKFCDLRLQRPAHGPKFAKISECLLLCKVGTEELFCDLRLQNNSSVPILHVPSSNKWVLVWGFFPAGASPPPYIWVIFCYAKLYCLRQLYLPTASDIAHYARSCGYLKINFSPSVTSCHLPRQMEAFFGGSKPTALHLGLIGGSKPTALQIKSRDARWNLCKMKSLCDEICLWQVV